MTSYSIAFGGPSPEHDISILTALQCERVLTRAGHQVELLYWDRTGSWCQVPPNTEARDYLGDRPDKATPVEIRMGKGGNGFYRKAGLGSKPVELGTATIGAFHGGIVEGGATQALFAMLGQPYTGGTVFSAALGMDKLAFGALLAAAGVPTLPRELLSADHEPSFEGPYIVKPRFGGSSIGIEVVADAATARGLLRASSHLRAGAVIEPFRDGWYDVNVGVTTAPTVQTSLIERPLRGETSFYDFESKYVHADGLAAAPRELPADLPDGMAQRITDAARRVAELVGLSGIARIDFLTDGSDVVVNEVNTIPGAMALYLWPDEDPAALLTAMLTQAADAGGAPFGAAHGSGAALRAAGGIAGKLNAMGPARS